MQGSAMMYAIGPTPAGRISPLRVYAHSFSSGRGAVSWHFLCPAFCAKSSGWIRTFILVVRLPTFPVCPAARAFMSVTLDQHYGRNIFRFFCRAASRSSVFLFCRPIQFVGWEADLASRPRCSSVLCRDGLYHVLGSFPMRCVLIISHQNHEELAIVEAEEKRDIKNCIARTLNVGRQAVVMSE